MLILKNIKVPIDNTKDFKGIIAKYLNTSLNNIISYKIARESIDARPNHEFCYVYEFLVEVKNENKYLNNKNISVYNETKYVFPKIGEQKLTTNPIIIGAGPAGLFAAYMLAKNGYKPVLYERGKKISERIKDVEDFWQTGKLNINSNVQFGEGGAGTFSDGKLNTLVKDKLGRGKEVLKIFVECGAPEEILYSSHPHIGSDKLREVISNMREKIISWGGKINYNSLLEDLIIEKDKITGVVINGENISAEIVVLAIGHSARDTFKMLLDNHLNLEAKPFAIGIRIVHPQSLIDKNQYPKLYKSLPPATYKLTYTNDDHRGVYSFCMCPGGYVVNASSEYGGVVTNGMSNYQRDSGFANSAIIVTVSKDDFGDYPLAGLNFMEQIEKNTYQLTQGKLAIQTFKDYESNQVSPVISNVDDYAKGLTCPIDINKIFPSYINSALKDGINYFDTKISGFKEGIILAPETRTSSPVRIIRNENSESNILGVYPCGEGSGYAGGITTSAIDGIKVAEEIAKKYSNVI